MKLHDIELMCRVVMSSGIATQTQRLAICQRLRDWFAELRKAHQNG